MKTIISDFKTASEFCAAEILRIVSEKNDAALAFSAEPCLYGVFDALAAGYDNNEANFSKVKFFTLTEMVGFNTIAEIIEQRLLNRINAAEENRFMLSEDNFTQYDELISRFGGLDAVFLGIGNNAGIGFNESGTPFSSMTHISKLSSSLKNELDYLPAVSDRGLTMGIKTVTGAKNIYLTAFGADKADAVFHMLYARNDTATPAAFLQLPMNVTVLLDAEASSKL